MTNPIANPGQFAAEEEVRQMLAMPALVRARATVGAHWRIAHGETMPADQLHRFEAAMDEYLGNYVFKAAACDPVAPRFVRNFMAPYHWNGQAVPGARMGGDNPDNCYRLAGIGHGGRYRVRVTPVDAEPAHVSFTLTGNWGTSVTIQTIEWHEMVREPDGSALIAIDADPVGERPNHLRTAAHAKFLFVRDSMMDWTRETPLALEIERLDRPAHGARPALDRGEGGAGGNAGDRGSAALLLVPPAQQR